MRRPGPGPYGQQMGRGGQQREDGQEQWPPAASGRFEDADEDPLAPSLGPRNRVQPCFHTLALQTHGFGTHHFQLS